MSRRALTLLVAGVAVVVAAVIAAALPVPYVILSPGPTLNTLGTVSGKPLIQIDSARAHAARGHLNLVTVNFQGGPGDEINIFTALRGWLSSHDAVVPQAEVFGTGQTQQQVLHQDVQEMTGSQQDATAAALTQLKIPFKTYIQIAQTEPGMPAAKVLKAGDIITAVNGTPVATLAALSASVRAHPAGQQLTLTITRSGKTQQLKVGTVSAQGRQVIGVVVQPGYTFPFGIKISVGDIGGPSAGLMFALGIIDKLGSVDLTGGKFIAGTGEITPNGSIQPIGGIQQKMAGARAMGATVFLVPAANCSDAAGAAVAGLRLVKVSTLAGAVNDLQRIKAGRSVPSC
ncbi:MAG TPA: PDZ domain-containing protein [Streptosporangiaceae bacterium]